MIRLSGSVILCCKFQTPCPDPLPVLEATTNEWGRAKRRRFTKRMRPCGKPCPLKALAGGYKPPRARQSFLPHDPVDFRRQCQDMVRQDARREIDRIASGWRSRRKRVRPGTECRGCAQMHLLLERRCPVARLGIQLDPDGARIEAAEIYFDLKNQFSVLRIHLQGTEVNVLPVLGNLLSPREKCRRELCVTRNARRICGGRRNVLFFCVLPDRPVRRKRWRQHRHTLTDARDPRSWDALLVALVEFGDNFVFKNGVERLGVGAIPCRIIAVFLPVTDRPSHVL